MREFASERPASVGPARPSPSLFRSPRLSLSLSPPRFRFPSVTPVSFHSECRSPFSTRCSSSLSVRISLFVRLSAPLCFSADWDEATRQREGEPVLVERSGAERSTGNESFEIVNFRAWFMHGTREERTRAYASSMRLALYAEKLREREKRG